MKVMFENKALIYEQWFVFPNLGKLTQDYYGQSLSST
jgi:hypothetical protein